VDVSINYRYESNAETDKMDAFADDANAITIMEIGSLNRLKQILSDFGAISGLLCNFDKTAVMHVGNTDANLDFFQETGFELVQQVKLLGFIIDRNGLVSDEMYKKARANICSIITQWSRFRLSLPGRIGIYKNLLLSQLGYYGSIVSPSEIYLESISSIMTTFVTGNKKVSKDRLFLDPRKGGLGLINLKTFFSGLQASWVQKSYISTRDNWRVDLHNMSCGNCYTANPGNIDKDANRLLYNIVTQFCTFTGRYYCINDNFKEMFIFRNNLLTYGQDMVNRRPLDSNFFNGNVPILNMGDIAKLKYKDFFHGNIFKSLDELNLDTGQSFSILTYLRLRESFAFFK
jgi:hypothetical protein